MKLDWYISDAKWAFVDPQRIAKFPSERGEWEFKEQVKMEDADWRRWSIDPEALRKGVGRDGYFIIAKPEGIL